VDYSLLFVESDTLSNEQALGVWDLLVECDTDFVPSLSQRGKESVEVYSEKKNMAPSECYLSIAHDHFILASDKNGHVVAFTCFKSKQLGNPWGNDVLGTFVELTCVARAHRGKGIAQMLYAYLENELPADVSLPYIARCTWSSNIVQRHLYTKFGYALVGEVYNQRGPGVHTLYYGKKVVSSGASILTEMCWGAGTHSKGATH
jgi:ribosomal protein S18 acetylase RimI-like enzyme